MRDKTIMTTDVESSSSHINEGVLRRVRRWLRRRFTHEVGEEIQTLIEERDSQEGEAALSEEERELIASALKFGDVDAEDACVPRSDIVFLSVENTYVQIVEAFRESGYSRLPVCGKDLDEVVGFITLKDIIQFIDKGDVFDVRKAMRPCTFVPEGLPIPAVLAEMRASRVQMAIVVDEYGGTAGLITVKDVLEELIGDLEDENEQEDDVDETVALAGGKLLIDARTEIEDLDEGVQKLLGADAESDDYDTVAGFVLSILGRMPEKDDEIQLTTGSKLVVTDADGRRVNLLTLIPNVEDDAD